MKTRSQRFRIGCHSVHAWLVPGGLAVILLSVLPLCAQENSGYDEKGQFWKYADSPQGATEKSLDVGTSTKADAKTKDEIADDPSAKKAKQFWQYEKSDAKSENSQPIPEYARRAAEGLTEESSADADTLGLLPGEVEPAIRQDELRGPGRWFFNTRIGQKFARFENGDIRRRPMMYWRRFADRQLPPILTFLFLLFFNTTICLAFRKRMDVASRCVSKSFWKSLFVGVIFVVLMASGARLCFDSALYTPCALLILGVVELLSLAGLAVSSRTVGLALMNKLGYKTNSPADLTVDDSAALTQKQSMLAYLAPVLVGTILFTLIALLPGLGPLPRLGTRFVMWFSLLGMGALVRTKLGRKELP